MSTTDAAVEENNRLMDELTDRLLKQIKDTDRVDIVTMGALNLAIRVLSTSTKKTTVQTIDILIETLRGIREDEAS